MATAIQMQPPLDRPSSFDQPRSRSTPPFAHHPSSSRSSYDRTRSPSPNVRPPLHHRSSSNASASSPYNQPFSGPSYFPQVNPMIAHHHQQPQYPHNAWATSAIPANAFYPSPMQLHPGQSFQQGFQQSQADFAAWATAYHQMVAASMANGHGQAQGQGGYVHDQGMGQPQPEYLGERRRTSSGQSSSTPFNHAHPEYGQHQTSSSSMPQKFPSTAQPSTQPYHPYKRGPTHRPSRENVASGGLPRSVSHPVLGSSESRHSPSSSVSTTKTETHRRTASMETAASKASVVPPPRVASRQESYQSEKERSGRSTPTITAVTRSDSPAPSGKSLPTKSTPTATPVQERPKTPLPLHSGPIANAINTPHPASAARPSPLSQATSAEVEKPKSSGLKSRLKKVLDKDASTPKKQSSTPAAINRSANKPTFASPSETSTRSATPPITPPQTSDFPPPSAPFAVSHPVAMGSEISLAETDRTATAPSEMGAKPKRSLFRMKNMSTDNISLSSTVSSASMMIRKMGSIGKLARRNSLMGISKIFKDKPKDEDAALPEKEGKKKKKQSKKDKAKAEAAPAAVSHATAEPERVSEEEDRALAGLSPAAKLARQHTLKSKAEQAKRDSQVSAKTGEPAWDNNTATRTNQGNLPSISSVSGPPEVLHVTPGRTSTVVHAVQVSEQEYDSDDSSDGETVEDVTIQLARSRLSDSSFADREFRQLWGNAWIDRNAIPKRGILKVTKSLENLESTANRRRANSSAQVPQQAHPHPHHGPLTSPQANADQVDGLTHPTPHPHHSDEKYNPFSVSFDPFTSSASPTGEHPPNHPYVNAGHNTSAPTLSLVSPGKPLATRSMTAPARKTLEWAPECAVYSTYDAMTYDRRSEPATCNRLTPELAQMIKQELNAFKLEMPVHPDSQSHTHFFA